MRERQLLRTCFDGTCIWRISNSKNVRYQYHLYPKWTSLQGFQIFWRKQLFSRALYKSCSKNIIESCYRASVNEITAIIHKWFWDQISRIQTKLGKFVRFNSCGNQFSYRSYEVITKNPFCIRENPTNISNSYFSW